MLARIKRRGRRRRREAVRREDGHGHRLRQERRGGTTGHSHRKRFYERAKGELHVGAIVSYVVKLVKSLALHSCGACIRVDRAYGPSSIRARDSYIAKIVFSASMKKFLRVTVIDRARR